MFWPGRALQTNSDRIEPQEWIIFGRCVSFQRFHLALHCSLFWYCFHRGLLFVFHGLFWGRLPLAKAVAHSHVMRKGTARTSVKTFVRMELREIDSPCLKSRMKRVEDALFYTFTLKKWTILNQYLLFQLLKALFASPIPTAKSCTSFKQLQSHCNLKQHETAVLAPSILRNPAAGPRLQSCWH